MEIIVTSDEEREDLFAELYHEEEQWAEIIYDQVKRLFTIKIYAPLSGDSYTFALFELQKALEEAKCRLMRLGYVEQDRLPFQMQLIPAIAAD